MRLQGVLQPCQYFANQNAGLLTPDFFKLRHETINNRPGSLLPDSDIFIAHGNYTMQGQRVACDFILETKARENDVRFLSTKLNSESLKRINNGLLPVLGYRQPPYNQPDGTKIFQLVIQLQPGLERSSLSHWICTEPALSLLERLRLCSKLARAIQTVHSIGLVHKSLHPRSVLILNEPGMPKSTGTAYLQDWTFIRELSGATTQIGEDLWPKRIYQHPERQGKYADAAYEPKHDIYSLGVCMLEVLLWKPFVVTDPTNNGQTLRICQLFESYGLARGEQDGGLPLRYQGDSAKLAGRPRATKTIWEDIAARELKDQDLTQLVLECLGSSFQTAEDVVRQLEVLIEARTP
jgi:serine/threonine protein kinase